MNRPTVADTALDEIASLSKALHDPDLMPNWERVERLLDMVQLFKDLAAREVRRLGRLNPPQR